MTLSFFERARPTAVPILVAVTLCATAPSSRADVPKSPAFDLRIAPSRAGRMGAWLVAGPYRLPASDPNAKPSAPNPLGVVPPGIDEANLTPRLGAPLGPAPAASRGTAAPTWVLASSGDGAVDVRAALHATDSELLAYAAGTLHVEKAGQYALLLGVDDGVRVFIDGRSVFVRDDPRPVREDDDLISLPLEAGDHTVVLKLHQRDGAWAFRARFVDARLSAPAGAFLALPGGTPEDARALAAKMSWVSFDRGAFGGGYAPRLTVRYPEGAPRGVPLRVRAKLVRKPRVGRDDTAAEPAPLFDVSAGDVRVDEEGTSDLEAQLPTLTGAEAARVEGADLSLEADVAGRVVAVPFWPRAAVREAIARADRVLTRPPPSIFPSTFETIAYLRNRLARLASRGDGELDAQAAEARELDTAASTLERGVDPFAARTGPMRRAYLSPVDGELAEFGLYVPTSYKPGTSRRYPLVVALHGLNGSPMAMLRWLFGGDDPKRDQPWEDRHVDPLAPLDAFVVAPGGHGNGMYRHFGEDDVVRVMDWAMAAYPIDRTRVSITGPSMGGIGAAAVAFHHPDRFAASAPLCGYHSYFVRRDVLGRPLRPWERPLAEERSNVFWAWNGQELPLYIVHGTLDTPESNSGVLISRYEELDYSVRHEHPKLGHNVWQPTYEDLKGAKWLVSNKRDDHPRSVRFRTMRLRFGDQAWVHIDELATPTGWGNVDARVASRTAIEVRATGVAALHLDRDPKLVDQRAPTVVTLGSARLTFAPAEPIVAHLEGKTWRTGPAHHEGLWKRGDVTGPLRDAFHAPLLFVFGADDPAQARANEEVARAWAGVRSGVTVKYPIVSDGEFFARGEALANDRALFLVGNARSNRVVRALEADFPIRVDGRAITVGTERFTGNQLGAAFVRPNPKRPDRYVVVVEGIDALGTWRSLSLPDLVPDFIVYDDQVAPARGQMLLGAGAARAAGFFQNDWSLPSSVRDPLAAAARPAARSDFDASPSPP